MDSQQLVLNLHVMLYGSSLIMLYTYILLLLASISIIWLYMC